MNEGRRRFTSTLAAVVVPVCCGCGRTRAGNDPASPSGSAAFPTASSIDAVQRPARSTPGAAATAPRCRAAESVLSIDSEGVVFATSEALDARDAGLDRVLHHGAGDAGDALGEVEIGDAVAEDGGYAVSLIHHTAAGRTCAVARLGPRARGPVQLVELGTTLGDAPPARLVRTGTGLLAAAYGTHGSNRGVSPTRELVAYAMGRAGSMTRATFAQRQQRDDSLAFDLASSGAISLVVWDEAVGPRGVIRAAALSSDESMGFGPVRDVSPADHDAESPRLVHGGHFVVFWLARRPEQPDAALDQSSAEALGEARAYGWIESADLDDQAVPLGAVRQVTPASGHVSAYDITTLADGSVLVVARDDGEAAEGSGGRLLRVRLAAGGVDPPLSYAIDGLGRGAPVLVEGSPRWISWVGPREELRLLPLDETGAPTGPSSDEDAMSDGRPLLSMGPGDDGTQEMLVAFPSRSDGQVRRFACAR